MDLRQILDFVLRRWKLIVGASLLAAVVAAGAMMLITPHYTATAQILLETRRSNLLGRESHIPDTALDPAGVDSQISVIRSINLLRRVVERHNLTNDPEFGDRAPRGVLAFIRGRTQPLISTDGSPHDQRQAATLRTIENLRRAIGVKRLALTYVITISFTSKDPAKAVRLANALAEGYVLERLEARYDAAMQARNWLSERIDAMREQVRLSEEAVASFRQQHNLAVSSEGTTAVIEQQLPELNAKLVAARAETAEKRARYEQARHALSSGGRLQAIPDAVRSAVVSDLRRQEAEVARKVADLAARYAETHPDIVQARAERRDIQRSISSEVARIVGHLKNDLDVATAREEALQRALDTLTEQDGAGGRVGVRLRELERINAANKSLFENLLLREKTAQIQAGFEEREARVISPAVWPEAPSFPNRPLVLALAASLGGFLALTCAAARQLLSSGFQSAREIEAALGVPVLASICTLSARTRRIGRRVVHPAIYSQKRPLSRYAEQLRTVRIGIQMSDGDTPAQVVLITSSLPKEGKSTLAIALARMAADTGQRTLLIDGDLRQPAIAPHFGLKGRRGLVDVLGGGATLDETLLPAHSITILPSGSAAYHPADLLGSTRMAQMIDHLRRAYDLILIDAPPVGLAVDAQILQPLADRTVYLVRWRSTPRQNVQECLARLAPGTKLAGIVLSFVDERKLPRYDPYAAAAAPHALDYNRP